MKKQRVTLSLGANLPSSVGAPADTLRAAIHALGDVAGDVVAISSFYQTEAVTLAGQEDVPDFVNACILMETELSPVALLKAGRKLEKVFGRKPGARWSARTLDIDLIGYGDQVLPSVEQWNAVANSDDPAAFLEEPTVPHPRAHVRGFVIAPLNDIAPDWVHPLLNQRVSDIYSEMNAAGELSGVRKISTGV